MKQPAVSICIPTYNYGKYIGEAIESVLSQTFDDFELVIIDDCSDDETESVINKYNVIDKSIRYYRNKNNIGMVNNWNLCLREARGKYVKFLFADDKFVDNDAVKIMYESLEVNKSAIMACSARLVIDERSNAINAWSCFTNDSLIDGREMIKQCILEQRNIIGEPTAVMYRREIGTRGFDPSFRQLVDLEMWLHLLSHGDLVYFNKPLVAFRQHSKQQSYINSQTTVCLHEMATLSKSYFSNPSGVEKRISKSIINYSYRHKIWKSYRNGIMSKIEAHNIIGSLIQRGLFYLNMPLYKVLNPLFKYAIKSRRTKLSSRKLEVK